MVTKTKQANAAQEAHAVLTSMAPARSFIAARPVE